MLPPTTSAATAAPDVQMAGNDSNSEDSSLSDNDRTLVEDDLHTAATNGADEAHLTNGFSNGATNGGTGGFVDEDDEEETYLAEWRNNDYYFKVTPVEYHNPNGDSGAEDDSSSSSETEKVIQVGFIG